MVIGIIALCGEFEGTEAQSVGAAGTRDSAIALRSLIVTATPIPSPAGSLGNRVTVLDGDALRARGITRLEEALRDVTGVSIVRTGSFGAVTSVFMRGGESDYVLVMVDGVPLNQPGGTVDLAGLTIEDVDRIEVLRGPASALYGSDAVAGVIHIITRGGSEGSAASLSVRAGAFGTVDGILEYSAANEAVSYGISLAQYETDGVQAFNNRARTSSLSGRVRMRIDESSTASITARLTDRRYNFPTDDTGAVVDINQGTFADESVVAMELDRELSPSVSVRALLTYHGLETGTDDAPDGPEDTKGFFGFQSLDALRRAAVDVRTNWRVSATMALTVGAELEHQRVRSWNESLSEFGTFTGQSDNSRGNVAGYLHLMTATAGFDLNGGVRIENNQRFGGFTTGRASVARQLPTGTTLRLAGGTGLKEPTFFETFAAGFAIGNPDLDPERSRSWEVGVDQSIGSSIGVDLTWFHQSFEDLIQYTSAPASPSGPNYFNIAKATARGLEAEVHGDLLGAELNVGWSWLDTEVIDSGFQVGESATFVEGEALLRRPANTVSARASGSLSPRITWFAGARWVGTRSDRDFSTFPATPLNLDAYSVLDAGLVATLVETRQGRPGFDLTVRLDNLGDARYEEAVGFAAPGRGLYLGGRLRWSSR